MIPVIYENLCSVCGRDLTHEEIEREVCSTRNLHLSYSPYNVQDREFEELFRKVVGEPRELQRFWMRRLVRRESFAAVAPTGIGKTTFGIVSALFFALNGKKSYILVPTTLLVQQCVENLTNYAEKVGKTIGLNEDGEITVCFYHSGIKKDDKERFQELLERGRFDVLVTTTQFLSKRFNDLKGRVFHFVFVDDVDAILKTSRNIDRVLSLLGFEKTREGWSGDAKGILMVSTATAKRGRSTEVFRKLLNFDVGSSFFTIRNVVDVAVNTESLDEIKNVLRRMGRGCVIYARTVEEAERYYELLKEEFKIGLVVSRRKSDYELFERGELDHLIGTAYFYGTLVRGLDLPEKIRHAVFIGAPLLRFRYEELTPKTVKTLALAFRRNEEVRKYLHLIPNLERHPRELEELKKVLRRVSETEKVEDLVVRKGEILFPDVRTYIQGSGRTSRLTVNGLTKGASFLFEADEQILKAFMKRAGYYDLSFKSIGEVDFQSLVRELEESRKAKAEVRDLAKPALFIVESPTKARIIARFFGRPSVKILGNLVVYEIPTEKYILLVTACLGHIVDLVTDRAFYGVETTGVFTPIYSTIKRCRSCNYQFTTEVDKCPRCGSSDVDDSKHRIESLRRLASETGLAIIGTDPDAEGEKIAWDLANLFSGLAEVKRIEFHEVTPKAINRAFSELRGIDMGLVEAQIVRRIEDRWIGFTLSQKLWKVFGNRNISAGRVQSPVLGWIIERDRKFRRKKKVAYIPDLGVTVEGVEGDEVEVEVEKMEEKLETRTPLPPYTTDELLRDANNILKIGSNVAMKLAQDLFESGLITYHRTDSTYVSKVGTSLAAEYLGEDFKERSWAMEKGAHECIRPTRPWDREMLRRMLYEGVLPAENITSKHLALYDLVFRRFMASQCREFEVEVKKYKIKYNGRSVVEERVTAARGRAVELFRSVVVKDEIPEGRMLVKVKHLIVPEEYPYTQADVVKLMRERSIGRPSTYSTIIEKLFLRKYVYERRRWLFPTSLGRKVYSFLTRNYNSFISEERTRRVLEEMDKIENSQADYQEVLREIYEEIKSLA